MADARIGKQQFERLRKEHDRLGEQLEEFRLTLKQRNSLKELADLMAALCEELETHFELEEADGYLDSATAYAPRLVGEADKLLQQHQQLLDQARALSRRLREAEDTTSWWDEFAARAYQFLHDLIEHERAENLLVQESYEQDIAGED